MFESQDLFTVTRRLATSLRAASSLPLIAAALALAACVIRAVPLAELVPVIAVMLVCLFYGIAHQIAAIYVLDLRRWAMQMALTLGVLWFVPGAGLVFLGLGLLSVDSAALVLSLIGGGLGLLGATCIRQAGMSIKRLDEDDGFSTDERPRPKGFEPVITSSPPSPPPPGERSGPSGS